jgi:hypothetical protein
MSANSITARPDRADVEADIIAGMSNVAVAKKYGLSKDAVRRHKEHNMPAVLAAVVQQREQAGAVKAVDRAELLYRKASAILDEASAKGDTRITLAAIKELRPTVELLAKLTGELDERPQVQVLNVQASPEWAALRGIILAALAPYPEAARAVAGALETGESGR